MISSQQAAQMSRPQRLAALGQIEAALKRNRKNVEALLSGAAIHYAERHYDHVIDYLQKGLVLKPNDLMMLHWLSIASAECRNFKIAKAASKKIVELKPGDGELWHMRARILDSAGDPSESLKCFEKVLEIKGESAELVFQMANAHTYMGETDKAVALYRRTLEIEPTHALALYGLSTMVKFDPADVDTYIDEIETAVPANKDMPEYNISALYYGAAKALEDVSRNDEAFAYFKKANDYRKPEKTTELNKQFVNNKTAFTSGFFERHKGWGNRKARPIFILGMPRSGTTLIESLIGAHTKVRTGGEMPMMGDIALKLGGMQASAEEFATIMAKIPRPEVDRLAAKYLEGAKELSGASSLFTDKMPHNFMEIGLIHLMFPDARIVHCKRHPIDICVSIYTNGMTPAHNYYKSSLDTLGTYYLHYLDIMAYWHELFPGKILDVYYEDVVANSEHNARHMIDALGLQWEDGIMSRENSQTAVRTLSSWQVRQPIYTSSAGKWRKFEKHLGPLIEALGDAVPKYEDELASLASARAIPQKENPAISKEKK